MKYLMLTVATLVGSMQAVAAPNFFSVDFQNDIFIGDDGGYTNGISAQWGYLELDGYDNDSVPDWIAAVGSFVGLSSGGDRKNGVTYSIGQAMQTPSDLEIKELIPEEAPYAGLLGWSGQLHSYDRDNAIRIGALLGWVGPASLAEQSQKAIHKITGSEEPEGWDNQLENEPVFMLDASRIDRLFITEFGSGYQFDMLSIGIVTAGTLHSELGSGLAFRWGKGLDASVNYLVGDLAGRSNTGGGFQKSGWHVFLNMYGAYVANDLFLEGNTFESSHSVSLEHWQGVANFGGIYATQKWSFLLSLTKGSDLYKQQDGATEFGTLSVMYKY